MGASSFIVGVFERVFVDGFWGFTVYIVGKFCFWGDLFGIIWF